MRNNSASGLKFLLCVGLCVVMGVVLIGVSHVKLQAAATLSPALPGLPALEAPAMPYPYTVERLAQEQKVREERYALQKQLRREEVQKRRELRSRMQEEEYKEGREVQEAGQKGRTQAVLCFLDDSEIGREDKSTPILRELMAAMVAEAGPMVVSDSLLAHLFYTEGNYKEIIRVLVKTFYNQFDSRKWIIKSIGGRGLYLLIPKKDFSQEEIQQILIDANDLLQKEKITAIEYKLGLKVNHIGDTLPTDTFFSAQKWFEDNYFYYKKRAQLKRLDSAKEFVEAILDNYLLVPRTFYDAFEFPPEMVFFIAGHGDYGQTIAGISIDTNNKLKKSQFQRMLDYFSTKIKTKLVVVSSCDAAGFNAQEILSELKEGGSTRIHPFHLVILAAGDVTTSLAKSAIDYDLKPTIFFDTFVQEVKGDLGDFDQIKRTILSLIPDLKADIIPQWRPAKSALWISLFEDARAVIRISKTMAATRKEPLVIKSYMDKKGNKHDPQMVLLAAESIPFDIVIDPAIKKIPVFVSVLPGQVTHTIKKLTYESENFEFNDFGGIIEYAVPKKFIIDELIIIKDGQKEIFTEVLMEKKGKSMGVSTGRQNGVLRNLNVFNVVWEAIRNNAFGVVYEAISLLSPEEINKVNKKRGYTLLTHAVLSNQPDGVYRALVAKGADALIQDNYGNTGLHNVCVSGTVQQVEQILRLEKYDVIKTLINMQGRDGDTALHYLALCDKKFELDKIKLLLKYGADKTIKNNLGQTPLDMAELFGSQEAIDFLSSYVQVKEPVYERAWALMESEDVAAIKLAIQRLSPEEINKIDKERGYTLLTHAVMNNQPDDVYQALLEKGANVLVKNDSGYTQGYTGFHEVCQIGTVDQLAQIIRLEKPEIVAQLINMPTNDGTALHLAIGSFKAGRLEKIELLLEHGADQTIKNGLGETPLDMAKLFRNREIIDFLSTYTPAGDSGGNDADVKFAQEISQPIGEEGVL